MTPVIIERSHFYKILVGLGMAAVLVFASGVRVGAGLSGGAVSLPTGDDGSGPAPVPENQQQQQRRQITPDQGREVSVSQTDAPGAVETKVNTLQPIQVAMLDTTLQPDSIWQQPEPRRYKQQTGIGNDQAHQPRSHDRSASTDTGADKNAVEYSVQVGVYADHDNALRQRHTLQKQGFDVLISDYFNKHSEKRYSIRIGPYVSYAEAKTGLHSYQQHTKAAGYIIKRRR